MSAMNFDPAVAAQIISDLEVVLLQTELGGRSELVAKFSYAGPGASTYSFGVLQFDVGNNPSTHPFLSSIGFSSTQIRQLSQRGGLTNADLAPLNALLQQPASRAALEKFTGVQLRGYIGYLETSLGIIEQSAADTAQLIFTTRELQLRLLDYINQFGPMSASGPMVRWLSGQSVSMPGGTVQLQDTLTGQDISAFVMRTQYGVSYPAAAQSRQQRLATALSTLSSVSDSAAA
jgi:hypothetical protein